MPYVFKPSSIKQARILRSWNHDDLAVAIKGVTGKLPTASQVRTWEEGLHQPTSETIRSMQDEQVFGQGFDPWVKTTREEKAAC